MALYEGHEIFFIEVNVFRRRFRLCKVEGCGSLYAEGGSLPRFPVGPSANWPLPAVSVWVRRPENDFRRRTARPGMVVEARDARLSREATAPRRTDI
jgi:hypothetical protein